MAFPITKFVAPLIAIVSDPVKQFRAKRYVGSCFWINSTGMFATCKHVLEAKADDEQIVVNVEDNRFLPIMQTKRHPAIDFAVGRTEEPATEFFQPVTSVINPGLDVAAWGYVSRGKMSKADLDITARLFKGHIVRMANEDTMFPAKSVCEVSFPSPFGFSGTALFHDGPNGQGLVGMLYGNNTETTLAYTEEESDGSIPIKTTTVNKLVELGLVHPIHDIELALAELGITNAFV